MTAPTLTGAEPSFNAILESVGLHLDRMVSIEAERFPATWTEAERRELAERNLFGRVG